MAEQQESMKEIVAALQDSEKGKSASLVSLLAQHQERSPAELPTTKSEVHICTCFRAADFASLGCMACEQQQSSRKPSPALLAFVRPYKDYITSLILITREACHD